MSRPRSRVQKPHGNVTRGGDGPLEGPPRGYKLHCSLVLAAMVKVFNGILLPLRSLEASSRESRSVAPLSSVVLISHFLKLSLCFFYEME